MTPTPFSSHVQFLYIIWNVTSVVNMCGCCHDTVFNENWLQIANMFVLEMIKKYCPEMSFKVTFKEPFFKKTSLMLVSS
jgi:hypothetical protein